MKAIQLCDQKGWSLPAPLLDPIEGLTAAGEGFLSRDASLGGSFSLLNQGSSDRGKQSSFLLFSTYLLC